MEGFPKRHILVSVDDSPVGRAEGCILPRLSAPRGYEASGAMPTQSAEAGTLQGIPAEWQVCPVGKRPSA